MPIHKAVPFGLQHILAMFVANIAPILIVGGVCNLESSQLAMLIQSAMLIAGIGTLIQLFPLFNIVGSGLPIVMGISFTFVSILSFIGTQYGYGAIMGTVLIGGLVEGVLGLFARYWIKNNITYSSGKRCYGNRFFTAYSRSQLIWRWQWK